MMSTFKCIVSYFKKHIFVFIISLLVIALVTGLSLVPPQLLRIIIDEIIPKNELSTLFIFSIYYLSVYVAIQLIDFAKEALLVVISQG